MVTDHGVYYKEVLGRFYKRCERVARPKESGGTDDKTVASPGDASESVASRRRVRKDAQVRIIDLKMATSVPEVVEWVDGTAPDPFFLVALKSLKNTVPVPTHWCQKKKYLQGKRGIVKKPVELPVYLRSVGMVEMRNRMIEEEKRKGLKGKKRRRLRPKIGKGIDYDELHDAFFVHQTKFRFTKFGDIYWEGKEQDPRCREKRPGILSREMREVLGMADDMSPPPWLWNMQIHGPPPAYPKQRIPGVNSPIPHGARWGFHVGGWGQVPTDEFNRPLYGDVFGIFEQDGDAFEETRHAWGEIEDEHLEHGSTGGDEEPDTALDIPAPEGVKPQVEYEIEEVDFYPPMQDATTEEAAMEMPGVEKEEGWNWSFDEDAENEMPLEKD